MHSTQLNRMFPSNHRIALWTVRMPPAGNFRIGCHCDALLSTGRHFCSGAKQFPRYGYLNDLALIHTAHPFVFLTPLIRPIALPRRDITVTGDSVKVIVSGWGYVKVLFDFIPSNLIFGYQICFSFLPSSVISNHWIQRRRIQDNCILSKP